MKRFIKKYNRLCLAAGMTLPLAMATGCADDVFNGGDGNTDTDNGVVLYIPSVNADFSRAASGTRSEGTVTDLNTKEAAIKSLTLFAYPVGDGDPQQIPLDDTNAIQTAPEGYKGYQLELKQGTYRMYVVANVDFTAIPAEDDLKEETVNVPDDLDKGLPMSCGNSELLQLVDKETIYKPVTDDDGVEIISGKGLKVKADLRFAVSKVRVTVLNNVMPEKVVGKSEILNVPAATAVFAGGQPGDLHNTDFTNKGFHDFSVVIPEDGDILSIGLDNLGATYEAPAANATSWIWQGSAYVGERLFAETASDKAEVVLTFPGGQTANIPLTGKDKKGIARSYFYDFVGTSTGDFQLAVQRWTPSVISGALHGEYFLHVDQTSIDQIEAGTRSEIWYESNADLDFVCGEYNGKKIYNITYDPEGQVISVGLSSAIKSDEFSAMKAAGEWKSFKVIAGTIEKTIEVKDIAFTEYMTLDKESVSIDVREQIASGHYNSELPPVTISTNLEEIVITKGNWSNADENENVTLKIGSAEVAYGSPIKVGESGEVKVSVSFKDLNDDAKFWETRRTFTFNVTGKVNGTDVTKEVTINLIPSVDNYEIHLYAPGWDNPHIYVYQCLKLPSTHPEHPNGPVGVDDSGNTAALEYSFTGAVAFRGWGVKGSDGNNHNDPSRKVEFKNNNFWVFQEEPSKDNWNPGKDDWLHHYYDMDFCSDYREGVSCNGCGVVNGEVRIDRDWPGIKMESEGGDWWKFTLSGVAKPGQALIMFTDAANASGDDHNATGEGGCKRYPQENEPGIPLFDFPSNVGYLDLTAAEHQFVEAKPTVNTSVAMRTIYFTNPDNWGTPTVHGFNSILDGSKDPWPGTKMTKLSSNLWMAQIKAAYSKVIFSDNGNNQTGHIKLTEGNTYNKDGAYNPNAPVVTDPNAFPTGKYRLTTSNTGGFRIWVWTNAGENISEIKDGNWDSRWTLKAGYPYEFNITRSGATELKYKKNDAEITVRFSEFTKEGDTYVLNIN